MYTGTSVAHTGWAREITPAHRATFFYLEIYSHAKIIPKLGTNRFFYGPALLSLVEPVTTILAARVSIIDSPFCRRGNICGNISISMAFDRKREKRLSDFISILTKHSLFFFEAFCLNMGLYHHTLYLNAVKRKCLHLDEGTNFN